MENYIETIKKIEEHIGQKFDFNNRRHVFHLKSQFDRNVEKYNALKSNIEKVLNGHSTYDSSEYRLYSIPENQR